MFGGIKSEKDLPKNEEGDFIVEILSETSISELVESLSLNSKPFVCVLNGIIQRDLKMKLKENDELSLFPPIAGGLSIKL